MKECRKPKEAGFTLIELMVSMVMALIIIAGLFLNFSTQNTEYSYQNRRIDSAQDLEFTLKFIAEDMRSALWSTLLRPSSDNLLITSAGNPTDPTTSLTFWVWNETDGDVLSSFRAKRKIAIGAVIDPGDPNSLRYDRQIFNPAGTVGNEDDDNTASGSQEILDNVTFFKIFQDDVTARPAYVPGDPGSGFIDIPDPMPSLSLTDSSGFPVNMPGYTILIEVAVPAGYTKGRMIDVLGKNLTGTADQRKRIWRYIQLYPMALVD
ncbi:MAG: type II secretion system protein [Mariprofundaceae bacterium]